MPISHKKKLEKTKLDLKFCNNCIQMTNHFRKVCLKCQNKKSEEWFAVLGTVTGIVLVAHSRSEATKVAKIRGCDISKNRIVPCVITYKTK